MILTPQAALKKMLDSYRRRHAALPFDDPRISYQREWGDSIEEGYVSYEDEPDDERGGSRPATAYLLLDGERVFELDYIDYADIDAKPMESDIYSAWIESLKEGAA